MYVLGPGIDPGHHVSAVVGQGVARAGIQCLAAPSKAECALQAVSVQGGKKVAMAVPGELASLKLSGITPGQVGKGMVLCPTTDPVRAAAKFRAYLQVLEAAADLIITPGFKAMFHAHGAVVQGEINKIMESTNLETEEKIANPKIVKQNTAILCVITLEQPVPLAAFNDNRILGRFVLRHADAGTFALGKVTELAKEK